MRISNEPKELVARYVALWNEPQADLRRTAIAGLWTEDGVQVLQPPQEIQQAAAALGVEPTLESRGHAALEQRVTRSHEEFVAPGELFFRPCENAARLHNIVKFNWEMVRRADAAVVGVGLEVLVLDDDGRIRTDFQFIEPG